MRTVVSHSPGGKKARGGSVLMTATPAIIGTAGPATGAGALPTTCAAGLEG